MNLHVSLGAALLTKYMIRLWRPTALILLPAQPISLPSKCCQSCLKFVYRSFSCGLCLSDSPLIQLQHRASNLW